MRDKDKTKEQLINELVELRQLCAELEAAETKHNQLEEALRESEERYRHLYEQSPIGVGLATPDGKVISCNKAIEAITGYSIEELKRMNVSDIYENPGDREALIEAINRYGEVVNFPVRLKRKDGTPFDSLLTLSRFHHFEGVDLFQTICIDITDRKQSEEALRASEEKYRALVENASEAVVVAQEGMLKFVNPRAMEITGYSKEELTSRPFLEFIHPDDREMVVERHRRRLEGEKLLGVYPFRIIGRGGNTKWVETNVVLINWEGRPATLNLLSDITERKRAEQALLEREKELEIKTSNLEEVNTALRVLLKRREEDKTELEEKVLFNVKELVVPYLEKLKKGGLDERQRACVGILESNLNDIISPFSRRLSSMHLNLTPREMEVANLVKHGKTTKEIAELLNVSSQAIDFHRKNIRRKIGIQNKKANLRIHLLSMQ